MTISVAEEANALSAGNNEACSNERSRKNECSNSEGLEHGMEAPPKRDSYTMEVDRGRNCYACRRFGYIACYYRNKER